LPGVIATATVNDARTGMGRRIIHVKIGYIEIPVVELAGKKEAVTCDQQDLENYLFVSFFACKHGRCWNKDTTKSISLPGHLREKYAKCRKTNVPFISL
jgi:hypothetical protein